MKFLLRECLLTSMYCNAFAYFLNPSMSFDRGNLIYTLNDSLFVTSLGVTNSISNIPLTSAHP